VGSVVVLAAGLIGLGGFGRGMTERAGNFVYGQFAGVADMRLSPGSTVSFAIETATTTGLILAPLMILIAVAGVAANVAQNGLMLSTKALAPKFDRLSPATGFKRIFSKRSFVEMVKSILKLAIVGAIIAWSLWRTPETLMPLTTVGLFQGYGTILALVFHMAATGAFALAILAILDFFFQRWDYEQQLKMSRQDVKDEHKQSEGDPQLKAKIRSRQMDMSRRRMMSDVKTADVVVTNPIHFAVALKYDPQTMTAPKIVAKGARLVAKRIRDAAREAGIPIVENPPLARALFKSGKVGGSVPIALYQTVAELLAFVYRRRERAFGGAR
jgi:flagellar biosynthetic protein FlhB